MKIYDVVIIGGGLAGLTLAHHLLRDIPDISVCLVHDGSFPNEKIAFKVGEATIDLGGYYLRELLGDEYFVREQFIKMGMRFIYTGDGDYKEMGLTGFPLQNSYQFERGKLENDVFDLLKNKIDIYQNTRFLDVEEDQGLKKIEVIELEGQRKTLHARWIVDASGRKKVLSKKYDLSIRQTLPNSSVWFRVDDAVLVDEIYPAGEDSPFRVLDRSISSLHIDGKGYWIWVLRLSDKTTSVGICFSEAVYRFEELSTLEKTFEWLNRHEKVFYDYLVRKDFPILDFKYLRKYASVSLPCISKDHWALTGDACVFLDPVYSSGVDFMCIENTYIVSTIMKERDGKDISKYIDFCNYFLQHILDNYDQIFTGMYERKDNWNYIVTKYLLDSAMFFGTICPFFMNDALNYYESDSSSGDKENYALSQKAQFLMEEAGRVYKKANDLLKKGDFVKDGYQYPRFVHLNPTLFGAMNCQLMAPGKEARKIVELLDSNLAVIEKLYEYISEKRNILDLYEPKEITTENTWRYERYFPKPVRLD